MKRSALIGLAIVLAAGCSAKDEEKPTEATAPKASMQAEYVSGIAAAYYCTCERWPGSWTQLRRFDDYLHAQSQHDGAAPMQRFDWSGIEAGVSVHVDGSLVVRPEAGSEKDYIQPFAVPAPDCSRFDRSRFASGCGA